MSTQAPLFSVIVPAYNSAETIERCVSSILSQTCEELELLVVDDCSSDATAAILLSIRDPRLVFFRSDRNTGPSAARNRALGEANGTFIIFADADDWLEPDYVSTVHRALQACGDLDFVATRYRVHMAGTSISDRQTYSGGDPLRAFLEDKIVSSVWAKVFRRSLIEDRAIRFPDLRYMEDSIFTAAYLVHARRALLIDRLLYNFDKRAESTTSATFSPELLQAADQALYLTRKALGSRAQSYDDALRIREFRMSVTNVLNHLARDQHAGRSNTGTIQAVRKRLWEQFRLSVLSNGGLEIREKAAYLAFLMYPSAALFMLTRRLIRDS